MSVAPRATEVVDCSFLGRDWSCTVEDLGYPPFDSADVNDMFDIELLLTELQKQKEITPITKKEDFVLKAS